jgi:hypothetical protein
LKENWCRRPRDPSPCQSSALVQRRQFVHPGGRHERIDGPDAPVVAAVLVWTSLQAWDDATVVVLKGQNVVEVRGGIPPGAPSTRSQFYNLKQEGADKNPALVAAFGGRVRSCRCRRGRNRPYHRRVCAD